MDKINRFICALVLKMAVKMSSVVKELMSLVFKLFCITAGSMHSFRIRSFNAWDEIYHSKYPVLDRIQGKWELFGSIIRSGILVMKRNIVLE